MDESLAADVLVRPDRPARAVRLVDVELIGEEAVLVFVAYRVVGEDRPELADPDRRLRLAHELRAPQECLLDVGAVDEDATRDARVRTAEDHAGRLVVMRRVDGVRVDLRALERGELGAVPIA